MVWRLLAMVLVLAAVLAHAASYLLLLSIAVVLCVLELHAAVRRP